VVLSDRNPGLLAEQAGHLENVEEEVRLAVAEPVLHQLRPDARAQCLLSLQSPLGLSNDSDRPFGVGAEGLMADYRLPVQGARETSVRAGLRCLQEEQSARSRPCADLKR
jgi:hypothetical protein